MGMVDYLSRFSSAAAQEKSHYDENFTVATARMIKQALYSTHQLNSRSQSVKKKFEKKTGGWGRTNLRSVTRECRVQ